MYSVERIYERFPIIREKKEHPNDPAVILNTTEAVFLNLAKFFENPKQFQMSLNTIHEHLKDDELIFALEVLVLFFQKDSILLKDVGQTFYNSSLLKEQLVSGTGFASMVVNEIKDSKIRPNTIHTYWQRRSKRLPRPDLIIEGVPYWKAETVNGFIEKEKTK
jgi:hypothetical protein